MVFSGPQRFPCANTLFLFKCHLFPNSLLINTPSDILANNFHTNLTPSSYYTLIFHSVNRLVPTLTYFQSMFGMRTGEGKWMWRPKGLVLLPLRKNTSLFRTFCISHITLLSNPSTIYILGISWFYSSGNQQTSKPRRKKKLSPNLAYRVSLSKRVKLVRRIEILASILLSSYVPSTVLNALLYQPNPHKHWEIITIIRPILQIS